MMPSLLRDSARNSSDARTRRRSTVRGIAIPCLAPIILIHMHRTLWMWAAIIRTVRRGTPGTALDHIAGGRFSMRYIVTRLFVRQAAIRERPVSRSVGTFVHSGSGALTPNTRIMILSVRMPTSGGMFKRRVPLGTGAGGSGGRRRGAAAAERDTVASASGDLRQQSVAAQLADEAADAAAARAGLGVLGSRWWRSCPRRCLSEYQRT